jgi:phage holin, LL-H family
MDTHALIFQLIQTVIELGIGLLVPFAVKFLMTKIQINKLIQNQAYAAIVVKAVQQTMDTTDAQTKKEEAVKRLSTLTKGTLSPEEIDSLIHDAVFTLKKQIINSMA